MNYIAKRLREAEVSFRVVCIPEETSMAGLVPNRDVPFLQKRLEDGKIWAWCRIKVIAIWADMAGEDQLECCSFLSESDFKSDRYYNRLKEQALKNLNIKVAKTFDAVEFKI